MEDNGIGPRLVLVLQDIQESSYQDFGSCSNCHVTLELGTSAFRFADTLLGQKSESQDGKSDSNSTTVLQALDIIFEVKRKSCFSKIVMDEDQYAFCIECGNIVAELYQMYIEFARRSQDPSFMKSILLQNKPLLRNRKHWDPSDGSFVEIKHEPEDPSNNYYPDDFTKEADVKLKPTTSGGDDESWILGLEDHYSRSHSADAEERPIVSNKPTKTTLRTSQRIRKVRANVQKVLDEVRAKIGPKPKRSLNHECSECDAKFPSIDDLKAHNGVHVEKTFVCPTCKGGFRTKELLERHVACFHQKPGEASQKRMTVKVNSCPECHMTFTSPSALRVHAKVHSNGGEYKCDKCGAGFKTQASVTKHKKTADQYLEKSRTEQTSEEKQYIPVNSASEDDEAQAEFISRKAITSEDEIEDFETGKPKVKVSKRLRKYKCGKYPDKFFRTDHLIRHVREHSLGNHYCDICMSGFTTLKYLERHIGRVHQNQKAAKDQQKPAKEFKCKECGSTFTRNSNLKNHMKVVHQVEDAPRECEICGLSLSSQLRFDKHMERVHRPTILEYKYTCEFCGKNYQNKDTLRKHRISHREDKMAHSCDLCSYSSKYRYLLSRHKQLVHIGTKPHLCNVCGTAFKSKHQLRLHTVRHEQSGVRPFTCTHPNCGKAFRRQANLHQHIQLHKGAKFDCKECGASFSRNGYLKVHHNMVHLGLKDESRANKTRIRKRKVKVSLIPNQSEMETTVPMVPNQNDNQLMHPLGPDLNNVAREENVLILPESPSSTPMQFQIIEHQLDSSSGVNYVTLDGTFEFYASETGDAQAVDATDFTS